MTGGNLGEFDIFLDGKLCQIRSVSDGEFTLCLGLDSTDGGSFIRGQNDFAPSGGDLVAISALFGTLLHQDNLSLLVQTDGYSLGSGKTRELVGILAGYINGRRGKLDSIALMQEAVVVLDDLPDDGLRHLRYR